MGMPQPHALRIDTLKSELDKWATKYIEDERLPCLALKIVQRGEVVLERCYTSKVQPNLDDDSIFVVMSCTKVATAVAAMQLLERGLWALEDPVEKFLPAFAKIPGVLNSDGELVPLERAITMRHLLTHTAGLTYDIMPFLSDGKPNPVKEEYEKVSKSAQSLQEFVDGLAVIPLVAQPGATWNYSVAIDVVGRAVEVLSGMPLEEYMDKFIFKPLGMNSTCFTQRATPAIEARTIKVFNANIQGLQQSGPVFYTDKFEGPKMFEFTKEMKTLQGWDTPVINPGGGLVSSVSDWTNFTQALLGSGLGANGVRILEAATVDLMASDHLPKGCKRGPQMFLINGAAKHDAMYTQGLGVAVAVNSHLVSPGTFEWGGMTSTLFWVDRKAELGVVCFTQLSPSIVYPLRTQLQKIVYGSLGMNALQSKL